MYKYLIASLFTLILVGCGDEGGNTTTTDDQPIPEVRPTAEITIHGRVTGTTTVYEFSGLKGELLAQGDKPEGMLKLSIKNPDTPILVCTDNATYTEIATNSIVPANNGFTLCAVSSYLSGKDQSFSISVFSHLAYALSKHLINNEGVTPLDAVHLANARVSTWLTIPIPFTTELDITDIDLKTAILTEGHTFSFLIAAISKMTDTIAVNNGVPGHNNVYNTLSFSQTIQADLEEGIFNGDSNEGQIYFGAQVMSSLFYRGEFAQTLFDVINSDLNQSGLTGIDLKAVALSIIESVDPMFVGVVDNIFNEIPTVTSDYDFDARITGAGFIDFHLTFNYGLQDIVFDIDGTILDYIITEDGVYRVTLSSTMFADDFYTITATATDIFENTNQTFSQTVEIFNTPSTLYQGNTFVSGGDVVIYDYAAGVNGAELLRTTTDIKGFFSIDLFEHSGPVVFELTGGRFIEWASGVDLALNSADVFHTVLNHSPGLNKYVNINTVTSIAKGLTDFNIKNGMEPGSAINIANFDIGTLFNFDILATIPNDITIVSGGLTLDAPTRYGFLLASFSQLSYNLSVAFEQIPHTSVNSLSLKSIAVQDIQTDGLLDGVGDASIRLTLGNTDITANTYRHLGALGYIQFSESPRNQTPFKTVNVLSLADTLNNSTNYLFGNEPIIPIDEGGAIISNFSAGAGTFHNGTFNVTANVTDIIGVTNIDLLINGAVYATATDLSNPSFSVDSTMYEDCNCPFTISAINYKGTVSTQVINVQIDNKRFLYLKGDISGTGVISYNPNIPGSITFIENNPDQIAAIHTSGSYLYTSNQKRYDLHPFNGSMTTFDNVAYESYSNVNHNHLMSYDGNYLFTSKFRAQIGTDQAEVRSYIINPDKTLTQVGGVAVIPDGKFGMLAQNPVSPFLYFAETERDRVSVIKINPDGSLTYMPGFQVTGWQPTDLYINKAGTALFVLYSVDNTLIKYKINGDGSLLLEDTVTPGNRPVSITVDHDEKYFYVLNKIGRSVSVYDINPSNGNLIEKPGSPYTINGVNGASGVNAFGIEHIEFGAGGDVLFINGPSGLFSFQNQVEGVTFGDADAILSSHIGAIHPTRGGVNAN